MHFNRKPENAKIFIMGQLQKPNLLRQYLQVLVRNICSWCLCIISHSASRMEKMILNIHRALHPKKLDIGYCLKTGYLTPHISRNNHFEQMALVTYCGQTSRTESGDIVTLKFGYWILPTEKGILGSLKLGYWDISLDNVFSPPLSRQFGISSI